MFEMVTFPSFSSVNEDCFSRIAIKTSGQVVGLSKPSSTLRKPSLGTGRTGYSVAEAVAAVRS